MTVKSGANQHDAQKHSKTRQTNNISVTYCLTLRAELLRYMTEASRRDGGTNKCDGGGNKRDGGASKRDGPIQQKYGA